MATLVAADLQQIAKTTYGVGTTVWHVAPSGNDSSGDGLSFIAPYATVHKATTVAAAGDLIIFSGTITETLALNCQAGGGTAQGVSIKGVPGSTRPLLKTAYQDHGFIRPGNGSRFSGFKIQCTGGGVFQYPFGLLQDDGDGAADDVLIEDVHVTGDTDVIFGDVSGCDNWRIRRCRFESKWDVFAFGPITTLVIEDNDIVVTGPSAQSGTAPTHGVQPGSAGTTWIIRRNRIQCSGSTAANLGILQTSTGIVYVVGNQITTSGTGAADIAASSTGVTDQGGNVGSGTNGALVTTGTITSRQGVSIVAPSGLDFVVVESGLNARQALSIIAAADSGDVTAVDNSDGTWTFAIAGAGVATARIVALASTITKERDVTITPPT